jgi:hypothetical protein
MKWTQTNPTDQPLTYAQCKAFLRLDDDAEEELVTDLIAVATRYAENAMGRSLMRRTITATFYAYATPLDLTFLPRGPVIALNSVTDATGCNPSGTFWSWVQVVPKLDVTPDPDSEFVSTDSLTDTVFTIPKDPFAGTENAMEVNGHKSVPGLTIVKLQFVGYTPDDEPRYVFAYSKPAEDWVLPVHDHRDNYNGGFAMAIYSPGTSLPQQPWAI